MRTPRANGAHLIALMLVPLLLLGAGPVAAATSADRGAVSAASPEAARVGGWVLEQGGNAADAAVAVSFVLGVTEPAMSGLGGGTQVLLALPGQAPVALDGATVAPALTPVDATREDMRHHRRSTVPSTVRVLDALLRRYGSGRLSWADLLAPAIRLAEEGFPVGEFRHRVYRGNQARLTESPWSVEGFLLADGAIPATGDLLRQPRLATTLRRLAEAGAADFYGGEIAAAIDADMRHAGGWIRGADLEAFPAPEAKAPLHLRFRGYDVYSLPPPCGGWTVLLALQLLQQFPEGELAPGTTQRDRHVLTALRLAHGERARAPVTNLADYDEEIARHLDPAHARALLDAAEAPAGTDAGEGGETTHFSVVDGDGMAVAVTASINAYFGAAAASPELGFLYNTYMDDFVFGDPEHPFAIRPGMPNFSSMAPTIVQKDGETVLVIGSPGSARIISTVAQLVQRWIDGPRDIEAVVAAQRVHALPDRIYLETDAPDPDLVEHFRARGARLAFPAYDLERGGLNAYFGGVHAIAREGGRWRAAADPRRDGLALEAAPAP